MSWALWTTRPRAQARWLLPVPVAPEMRTFSQSRIHWQPRQTQHERAIETARALEVEILDGRGQVEAGQLQEPGEPAVIAVGEFAFER